MSANSAFAQGDCAIPIGPRGQIDVQAMAGALSHCAERTRPKVWVELVDQGRYELTYSAPEGNANRRITGVAQIDWSRDIPMAVGTIFGFRAVTFVDGDPTGEMIDIITYPPNSADGPAPPEVSRKPLTPDAVETALFLIGSDAFLIPGEWRIEIRHADRILAAQRFVLTPPATE